MITTGRQLDARPRLAGLTVAATLTLAVLGLTFTHLAPAVLVLVLAWGAAAAPLPVILQAAVLRVAPGAPDTPSGMYVVAYQAGISGGSALGAVLLDHTGAVRLPLWSAVALAAGTILVAAATRTFGTGHCWPPRGTRRPDHHVPRRPTKHGLM